MPLADPVAQVEYQRNWVAARRAKWFTGKSCVDCGLTEDLELDHVDRTKKVSHRIWSWSWMRIEKETANCVVRCHTHHVEKSNAEKLKGSEHGMSVLTEEIVLSIRRRVASGEKQAALARELNVHKDTISCIVLRKTWAHI